MRMFGRVTIYPLRCAMHGAVNIWTRRWGYVCFKPPTYVFGQWWPWYLYLSPNATPWGATLILGRDRECGMEKKMARLRRVLWGHGYDTEEHDPQEAQAYLDSFAGNLPPGFATAMQTPNVALEVIAEIAASALSPTEPTEAP